MSGEIERYRPPAVERLERKTVDAIAGTALIPEAIRGNVPAIIATILKGRALGLDDMHALTALHWINGKPVASTETTVACVRRAGHSIKAEYGDGSVTATGRRGDNGDEASVTWTLQMAQRAGLLGKDVWKKYPEAMLWNRAASQLCRILFADVLAGVSYTPEELELTPEEQVSEAIGRVGPPDDDQGPDDTPTDEPSDEPVIDADAELVPESEGEPQPAEPAERPAAGDDAGSPTADMPVTGSGSPSETDPVPQPPAPEDRGRRARPAEGTGVPATDAPGQGSIFAQMAESAQSRRGEHKDPAA